MNADYKRQHLYEGRPGVIDRNLQQEQCWYGTPVVHTGLEEEPDIYGELFRLVRYRTALELREVPLDGKLYDRILLDPTELQRGMEVKKQEFTLVVVVSVKEQKHELKITSGAPYYYGTSARSVPAPRASLEVIKVWSENLEDSKDDLVQNYHSFCKAVLVKNVAEHGCIQLEGPWHRQFLHAAVQFGTDNFRLYEGQPQTLVGVNTLTACWYGTPSFNTLPGIYGETTTNGTVTTVLNAMIQGGNLVFDGTLYKRLRIDTTTDNWSIGSPPLTLHVVVAQDGGP